MEEESPPQNMVMLAPWSQIVVHLPQQYTVINQTNAPFFGSSQFPEELESKIHLNCSFTRDPLPTPTYCAKFVVTRPVFLELL